MWLHIVNFVPEHGPGKSVTQLAVLDEVSDFISCGSQGSRGQAANYGNLERCCCFDKTERKQSCRNYDRM